MRVDAVEGEVTKELKARFACFVHELAEKAQEQKAKTEGVAQEVCRPLPVLLSCMLVRPRRWLLHFLVTVMYSSCSLDMHYLDMHFHQARAAGLVQELCCPRKPFDHFCES